MSSDDRPVLVGMNNPYGSDPAHALYPLPERATGWRIWQMLRLEEPDCGMADYRDAFDRRNLLVGTWSDARARDAAPALAEELVGRTVVVLGAKLRDVLRLGTGPCGSTNRLRAVESREIFTHWHWVPHPSGLCQWYNDDGNRRRVARLLARLYLGEKGVLTI